MKISVIIPIYRPKAYLWECLNSLRAQTLPASQWEVVMILNGDEQPYRADIEAYMKQYPAYSWTLLYSAQAGVSHARNLGLQAAQGHYICFIDDDDYVSPAYLEALLQTAEAHPSAMPLSHLLCFHDGEKQFYPDHISANYQRIKHLESVSIMQARQCLSGPVAKLLSREHALQSSFNPRFANGEDALYIFSISRFYKSYSPVNEHAVYYRRVRGNSARHHVRARLNTMLPLMWAYFSTWLRHPFRYHFLFFATRFLAIPKGIWKIYREISKNK